MNTRTLFRKENGRLRISRSGRCSSRLTLLVLLLGIFAFGGTVQAQTTVTIGTGTSTHYYTPVNNFYCYTYTQTLFTAAEIQAQGVTPGVPQTISSIAYNYAYSSAMTSKTNCTIYMGHTSATSFSSTSDALPLSSLTMVYTGSLNSSQGWTTFTLTTPFVWDGVNSLVVAVDDNSGTYNGNAYTYYYTSASANRAMWFYSDTYNPDPSSLSSFSGSTSVSANRTNTRFVMTPLTCPGTTAPTISGSTVTWTELGTATSWAVEYGRSGFTPGTGTRVVVNNTPSYTLTGLTNGTVYDVYVRSLCNSTDSSGVKKVSFLNNPTFNCGGTGTRNDPYLICNETDLRQLSTYVNAGAGFSGVYFKLAVNIQMQQGAFTPIGSPTTPFEGTFFGAGHSITNLTMTNTTSSNRGLFGYVRGAYIDSVTVGGTINGGDKSAGIVGEAVNSTIRHCTNNASVQGSYQYHAGIVGYMDATTVEDCRNTGLISDAAYYHAGIVGYSTGASVIRRCKNTGTINGYSYYHSGICGYMTNSALTNGIGIFNCTNKGAVTGSNYTGGICGYANYVTIDTCSNRNMLYGYSYFGGVCGALYYGKVLHSSNIASITNNSTSYTGGIVGYAYGSSSQYCYVQYCVNSGPVSSISSYVGGVCGRIYYTYLDYCSNSADVSMTSSSSYTGGICGYASTNGYIRYCLNGGLVTSNNDYVGGITGYSYGSTYTTYCLNVNNVKGGSGYTYIAAIAGTGAVANTCYWDVQMCPTGNFYGTTASAGNALQTSQLRGTATYPSTSYFNASANMYPMPKGISDSIQAKLAATPIYLYGTENVNSVQTNFTVHTGNNVVWTSSQPAVIAVNNTNATVNSAGNTQFSGTVDGLVKHINIRAVQFPTFCGGSGTQADPYRICNPSTLDSLRMFVNSGVSCAGLYFRVMRNLDMSAYSSNWNATVSGTMGPIGASTATPFSGHFDGAGYTISNITINNTGNYKGLFGYVVGTTTDTAEIHDFTFSGSVTGGSYTGGIVGYANYTKMYNLVNNAPVSSISYSYHGGICGQANQGCVFDSCRNTAAVAGSSYTGGITGYAYYYTKFENCTNTGSVTSTSSNVGGIVGYWYPNTSVTSVRMYNCKNEGNVSGTSYYVGGLVGYGYYSKISNCINRGNVSGASYGVGGLIGYNYYYSTINNSINYGDVTSSGNSTTFTSSGYGTGGIVGSHNYGTSTSTVAISHCKNYGNVSSMAYGTGGIIGQCYYYPGYIEYCENYGDVTGTYYTGGITGFNRGTYSSSYYGYLRYCANAGDVTGTDYVGGIAGRNGYTSSGYYAYVTGCVNIGRVSGNSYIGGIVGQNYGYSSSYPAYVQGCLNSGIVSGTSNYVGGITGYNYSSYAQNQYNLNVANVISSSSYVGAVEGYSSVPTGCYYDTLMCPRPNYYYGGNAGTTYAKRTSYLTSGSFTPSATYFTATPGLYPRPTQIKDSTIAILAATPVFLDETTRPTNHVNNVNICFTVGTANNVSWTSSLPTVASVVGANGTPLSIGNTTATVSRDSCERDVDLRVSALPPVSSTFAYNDDIDGEAGRVITSVTPTSSFSGCKFVMASPLPAGLVLDTATGEISGTTFDIVANQTLVVRAICSGCNIAEARLNCNITPAIICASDSIDLPAGYQWYYDSNLTIPVPNKVGGLTSNHRYYAVDTTSFGLLGVYNYSYTGAMQTHPVSMGVTQMEMEVWGAQGGSGSSGYVGGKGGYSMGTITNTQGINNVYVFVGGQGTGNSGSSAQGGWNGGGNGMFYSSYYGGSGGGATDIRINGTTFDDRVIVAGGGGGAGPSSGSVQPAGCGGGEYGGDGYYNNTTGMYPNATNRDASGASQTAGGIGYLSQSGTQGSFGQGGNASTYACGGGGGGWYGGGGAYDNDSDGDGRYGGGGSGYVWTSSTAASAPSTYNVPSSYYLSNAQTIAGNSSFDSPNGSTETGHTGNGYARITEYGYLTMSYLVRVRPTPTAEISGDTTICNNDSARLQIVFTGTAPYHYRITGDNADRTSNSDTAIVYVKPTTSTYYYVTYAEYQNCEALPLDLMGRAAVGVCGEQVICDGDSITLSAGNWYLDSFYTISVSASVVHPTTTTTYYNYNGSTLKAIVYPRPTVTIPTAYDSICDGASITLPITFTGTAPFYYLLAGDSTYRVSFNNSEVLTLTPMGSIVYQILDLYDVYCTAQYGDRNGVYTVNVCDQPIICAGDTVVLPSNRPWYYDAAYTQRVPDTIVNPTVTTTYYSPAISPSDTVEYSYTGSPATFTVPAGVDSVFLQVWGAQGGDGSSSNPGGKGGYSEGRMHVQFGDVLSVYVGGSGEGTSSTTSGTGLTIGGWNGGGNGYQSGTPRSAGGGATDIRVNGTSLNHRVIVAGGGAGNIYFNGNTYASGHGGGLNGVSGTAGTGGTQTSAGTATSTYTNFTPAAFGTGGSANSGTNTLCGGGGGWYGGGYGNSAGGGSGYVWTASSSRASGYLVPNAYYLANARTVAGNQSFPSPSGTMETGHPGNGHARISYQTVGGGEPPMTYTVRVNPTPTATIIGLDTACDNAPANLIVNFTGTAPYVYHIVGEPGSRMSYNNTAYASVIPDTVTTYRLDMISDANCVGTINNCFGQAAIYHCGQDVICQGDSVALPLPYTWYTDRGMRNFVMTAKVAPRTTTTYYRPGQNGEVVEHLVIVKPRPVARIISSDTTICGGHAAIKIRFSGNAPYTYRFTSESADRISWTDTITNYVSPQYITRYNISQVSDQFCTGSPAPISDEVTVMICNQAIICEGDSIQLPNGHWFFDSLCNQPVPSNNMVAPRTNQTYYPAGEETYNYAYTGHTEVLPLLSNVDSVKMEVWGAQGGYRSNSSYAGKGGYAYGTLTNVAGLSNLYISVGQHPGSSSSLSSGDQPGGWNGGGYRYGYKGGGGATDIAIAGVPGSIVWNTQQHLYSRIIVAGGGGSDGGTSYAGGAAGVNASGGRSYNSSACGYAGNATYSGPGSAYTATTQTTTGLNAGTSTATGWYGGFGFGGAGYYYSSGYGGAGGGGWYGGCGTMPDGSGDDDRGGGGGSGYVWTAATASNVPTGYIPTPNYYLVNAGVKGGSESFNSPSGSSETGHSGNGAARITVYSTGSYTIVVQPRPTATISARGIVCGHNGTYLDINFAGYAPFTYRLVGDSADRVCYSNHDSIYVCPSTITNYRLASLADNYCIGQAADFPGIATVNVCAQTVICHGDTFVLDPNELWYYDQALRLPLSNNNVSPDTTTRYYSSPYSWMTVNVNPAPTATILTPDTNICGSGIDVRLEFTGTFPFRYRMVGDTADRISYSNHDVVHVDPTATTRFGLSFVEDAFCQGTILNGSIMVTLCNQPIICAGDTVQLPAGTWYYDAAFTQPVPSDNLVAPTSTTIYYMQALQNFSYTGREQTYVVPQNVTSVEVQVWGAEGGDGQGSSSGTAGGAAGLGGYSRGTLPVNPGDILYVYVGQKGEDAQNSSSVYTYTPSFNGGGAAGMHNYTSYYYNGGSGGGATDVRVNSNSLYARAIVAGGGGGGGYSTSYYGGYGGGTAGGHGYNSTGADYGQGATQSAGGTGATNTYAGESGSFGLGGQGGPYQGSYSVAGGGGGGGGWYGGGGGKSGNSSSCYPGGGGSGYVYTSASASNYPSGCLLNSYYYMTNTTVAAGNTSFESPTGGTETGHTGNGYARITGASTYTVSVNPAPTATLVNGYTTICNNANGVTLTITFSGTAPFTYRLTGDTYDRVANSRVEVITLNPSQSTNYQVVYLHDAYCEAIPQNLNGLHTVIVCDQPIICAGDTVELPTRYTWYTDSTLVNQVANRLVSPATTTTYYRQGSTYTVTVNQRPTARISGTTYICGGNSATLTLQFTGAFPITYRITGDRRDRTTNTPTVRIQVTPSVSTNYTVTMLRDQFCEGIATDMTGMARISVCEEPTICAGDSVNLPSGQWYYDSLYTNPVLTGNVVAPDSTTTYYARITSIGSQFNTYTVHVYNKPTSVLIGGDTICDNDTAMLVVNFTGVAPFIYRLTGETQNRVCNNSSDTIYVRPTLSTNYRITMLYDSLCEGRPADMVGAALVVVCNQPVVCEGTAVQLDLNRTWYYDYAMTRPLTSVTVVPTATTTYYSAEGPFTITVIPRPKASIVTDMAELCDGDSTVIVRINFTGTAPFTYRLTGDVTDRVCNGNSATLVLSPTRPIVYRVVSLYDAVCEANYTDFSGSFDVTFCNMVSVCSGDLVELPDRGSRWFLDSACTIPVPSNTIMPTSNVTYYRRAGWITRDFQYTGTVEEFIIPQGIDTIKMEVWGASGGYRTTSTNAGAGGYARGTITNTTGLTALYVYVGQSGNNVTSSTASIYPGGWNGGGYRYLYKGGGGATDIALQGTAGSNVWNSAAHFNSRIIVAGGGGSDGGTSCAGGAAGGTVGTTANSGFGTNSGGGNQTYSGTGATTTAATQVTVGLGTGVLNQTYGGFGFGGSGVYYSSGYGGAGGGGWYGGCGTYPDGSSDDDKGGSGGSGFVWTPATAASVPAGYTVPASAYLANATTTSGSSSFLAPDSTNETGHRGDGYARIVYRDNTLDSFTIIVNRSYTSIYYDTMGRGEYYHFCGMPYTQGGTYSVNLYTMNGCDSTLILNLAEIDTTVEDRYINICKDETYTLRGVTYDRTGDYVNVAHHEQACDTIINLHLTIWDTTFNYMVDTICAGDTMFINDVPYFTSGHYVEYLRTVIGCDSVVDLTLTVRDTIFDIRDTLLCYEGVFEFYGNYYDRTQPGTYTHIEQSVLTGCDSIIVVNVSFRDRSDTTIWDTICENSRYNFCGNYFFNTGTYVDTLVNQYGCDSIITLNLYRLEYPSIYLRDSGAYCINGSTNLVVTTNGNTIDWVSYPVDTTMAQHHNDTVVTVAPKVKTLYTVTVDYAPYNCVSTATIMIKTPDKLEAKFVTDPNVITMPETQIKFTDQSIGTVVANKWIFPDYITENRKEAYYTSRRDDDSIQVILIVEDTNTCQDTTIQVIPVRLGEIWIPNVFTPDSKDGNHDNEIFKVVTFEVTDFEIHIYSRAGQLVFESTDPTEGWDGTHNGVKCQGGSYVYIVKYRLPRAHNQRVETRTGSVLLVR